MLRPGRFASCNRHPFPLIEDVARLILSARLLRANVAALEALMQQETERQTGDEIDRALARNGVRSGSPLESNVRARAYFIWGSAVLSGAKPNWKYWEAAKPAKELLFLRRSSKSG